MPKVSVIVCCANAADTLAQACESVAWADELIVVDSGSEDATGLIAQRYAHRYLVEPWRGHTEQKRFATTLASHDWVFILDGDETCSPTLAEEIRQLPEPTFDACDLMIMPRRNYIMGRYVRAWSPDHLTRLFHRDRVRWLGEVLHDTREASDPSRVRRLRGWIEHKRHSRAGFSDYFSGRRMDDRVLVVAQEMFDNGKRCRWWDLWLRPFMTFLKFYVLKRGCLDGEFGVLISQKAAVSVQVKYAALWAVQNGCIDGKPASEAR